MKSSKKIEYACVGCMPRCIKTNILHEIFPGSSRRQACIDTHLQIPVCYLCHSFCKGVPFIGHKCKFSGLSQEDIRIWYCDEVGIDFVKARFEVFNNCENTYLESTKDLRLNKLLEWNYDNYELSQMQRDCW